CDVPAAYRRLVAEVAPDLAEKLEAARLESNLRGSAGPFGDLRRPWGPGGALVGDAGYFKDPISGPGISDRLRDAAAPAGAVVRGDEAAFALYEAARDEMSLPLFEATEAIASLEWDNERLKGLHQSLSDAMKQEVAALLVLHEGDEDARWSACPREATWPPRGRGGRGAPRGE